MADRTTADGIALRAFGPDDEDWWQNDSRNVEVLGLNAQLGYVAYQERIRLRREPTASVNR